MTVNRQFRAVCVILCLGALVLGAAGCKKTEPGKGGEIQLADAQNALAKAGKFVAYEYEGRQFDTGDPLGFLKANIFYSWNTAPEDLKIFVSNMIGCNSTGD